MKTLTIILATALLVLKLNHTGNRLTTTVDDAVSWRSIAKQWQSASEKWEKNATEYKALYLEHIDHDDKQSRFYDLALAQIMDRYGIEEFCVTQPEQRSPYVFFTGVSCWPVERVWQNMSFRWQAPEIMINRWGRSELVQPFDIRWDARFVPVRSGDFWPSDEKTDNLNPWQ